MEIKRIKLMFSMLLCLSTLSAQTETAAIPAGTEQPENTKKNYFIQETEQGIKLIQRLSWEKLEDIFGFEVELEQRDKKTKTWKRIDKQTVKTNYLDVSLSPGNYRYRVRVINLLEQKEEASPYRNFDVRFAYQPEVESVSPKIINFDEMDDQILTAVGKNFHEDTQFILKNNLTGSVLKGTLVQLNEAGTNVTIAFEFTKANPGSYTFLAVDPSDLFAKNEGIVFRFQKPVDVYLSGGYFFSGFVGSKVFKTYFGKNFAPLGGGIRLSVIPIKRYYGNFGFNLTGSGLFLRNKTKTAGYTLKAGMLFTQLNATYMFPIIKHRLTLDIHAGFGAAFLINTQFTYPQIKSPKFWYWGMTINAGTALYVYMHKKLFLEINLDHIIPIRKDFPKYIIQPQIAVGWEF